MKKTIALFLLSALAFSVVGCSGSPSGTSNDTTTQNETATDPEPTAITLDNSFVIVHATSVSDEELAAATTIKAALTRKGIQATH